MKFITNSVAIVLFLSSGKTVRVEKTDKKYPKVLKTFELPLEEQEDAVEAIINEQFDIQVIHGKDGFEVVGEDIYYQGDKLPEAFATKVKSIIKDGLPVSHFEKFWDNLKENPSFHVVNEIGFLEFLEYKELPITEDGCFIAYRGVQNNYWSISGNLNTKVLQGQVNSSGQIFNGIGEIIEVRRNGVSDDRNVHCHSLSLHIGSLDYARGWGSKLVVVKVNPKDVVSVPNDCNAQKCRVCKFEVIADFVEEITASVVDEEGDSTLVTDDNKERDEFITRVAVYLDKKEQAGLTEVTVRQIQSSFSPYYPSKEQVLDALQDLWYSWDNVDGVLVVEL